MTKRPPTSAHCPAFRNLRHVLIIAIRYRQRAQPSIHRAGTSRLDRSIAQSFKSSHQAARLVVRCGRMITSLARIGSSAIGQRNFNCWTAAITKKHRRVHERTYPTTLVLSDGSSIEIEYHEPRKIITLPLNIKELTPEQQKKRLEMRKPKKKIVIAKEIEDTFDENKYLNFKK
ncbi:39S ribosomal protein L55, mitochondrial [Camponotus floridanus]|uniref:39S ribosomal protein L55, mitochondrial n=1 Tax=Camponotus floridanus TaxID=104421 RepID=UPI000DC69333|nr:39S ribosomal protein L55, mitochondrial [Camponotus floridanus]